MMPQVRAAALTDSARPRFAVPGLTGVLAVVLLLGGCAGLNLPWLGKDNLRGGYAPNDRVAAILPGAGPLANVAEAVREGLRAAHGADDTGTRPGLDFIASDQSEQIAAAYNKAVGGGATQVIGPLPKPAVDVLAKGPALKVPTLALNQATNPGKAAPNLYQFALTPEADAIQAADKAKAQGFTRALVLVPQGEAGQRRADAFRRQWKTLGGTLTGEVTFDPAKDPAKEVSALLAKGKADVLFLAADADQALRAYPALRGKAAALPVIATSAVFSGSADAARDKALVGLYFVETPWMLGVGAAEDPLALAKLKRGSGALATPLGLRLYAMGIDAYRLAPRLTALARTPGATFPGATGALSIDAQGRVQRTLTLAQFAPTGPKSVTAMTGVPPAAAPPGAPAAKPQAKPEPQVKPARPRSGDQPKPAAAGKTEDKAKPAAAGRTGDKAKPAAAGKTGDKANTEAKPATGSKTKAESKPAAKPKPVRKRAPAAAARSEPGPATAPASGPAPTPIANLAKTRAAKSAPAKKPEPEPASPGANPQPAAPAR